MVGIMTPYRTHKFRRGFIALLLILLTPPLVVAAELPQTPSRKPDFGGTWFYGSATPLVRPAELGSQLNYSPEEARRVMSGLVATERFDLSPSNPDRSAPPAGAAILQEADHNFAQDRLQLAKINGKYRTSLIVSPTNGQLPYRDGAADFFGKWKNRGVAAFDHPEIRSSSERCINIVGPMAPMVGWFYNANMRIVQTKDHLVIDGEMLPPRIIPISTSAPQPPGVTRWEGESTSRWQGDTLHISTRRLRPETSWFFFRYTQALEVEEQFTLISRDEIFYRYTATDKKMFTEPMIVEMSIKRRDRSERLFEFACHEGNHSFGGIMRGARVQEQLSREQ